MWEKSERQYIGLIYRRKYHCTKCDCYSLYIMKDNVCECENDCDLNLTESKINQIIQCEDFNGYFTRDELSENFYFTIEKFHELSAKTFSKDVLNEVKVSHSGVLSKRNIESINKIFANAYEVDQKLDDLLCLYYNNKGINKTNEKNTFFYLVSLVEDIHYFLNLSHKDIILLDIGLKYVDNKMFSGRFFFDNYTYHIFSVYERIYCALGILYGYRFSGESTENKSFSIKNHIKNVQMGDDLKTKLYSFNSSRIYSLLLEGNAQNRHDLSYINKIFYDEIFKTNTTQCFDRDSNEIELELFSKPDKRGKTFIHYMVEGISSIYEILTSLISQIDINKDFQNAEALIQLSDIKNETIFGEESYFTALRYSTELEKDFYKRLAKISEFNTENLILKDCLFRNNEIRLCAYRGANLPSYLKELPYEISHIIRKYATFEYFVNSALMRTYSCYDKLAKYIKSHYSCCNNIDYFEHLSSVDSDIQVIGTAQKIISTKDYEDLLKYRNRVIHTGRMGIYDTNITDETIEQMNLNILYTVMVNRRYILQLMHLCVD